MIKRSTGTHLAMVASVLICLFAYMGYHYLGRTEGGSDSDASQPGAAGPGLNSGLQPPPGLAPPGDPRPSATSPRSPGGTSARSDDEFIPDIASMLQPDSGGGASSLRPPPSGGLTPPPASSNGAPGIIATPSGGQVTGLVPDDPISSPARDGAPGGGLDLALPPLDSAAGNSGGAALTPPPSGSPVLRPPDGEAGTRRPSSVPPADAGSLALPDFSAPAQSAQPDTATVPPRPNGRTTVTDPVVQTPPPRNEGPRPPPARRDERIRAPVATPVNASSSNGRTGPAGQTRPGGATSAESTRVYIVRSGDTLSRIAARELGSTSLADNIFLMNTEVITDPDHLEVGMRIILPARKDNGIEEPPASSAGGISPYGEDRQPGRQARVHVVARGDTLSSIALRYYGSSNAWRFLYQANANTIANPNRLTVGTQLLVPPYNETP